MKLILPRSTKAPSMGYKGSSEPQQITVGQVERVRVEPLAEDTGLPQALADGYSLTLLAVSQDGVVVASCSAWEDEGENHLGWLDLRTDPAMELANGAALRMELQWDDTGHLEISDEMAQRLTVKRPLYSGEEDLPDSGSLAAFAAFLGERIVAEDDSVVITPDAANGRILVRSAAAAGSSIAYAAGFLSTEVNGVTYKWAATRVP